MALFIRQSEERSKLQERLAAELQERAKQRAALNDRPDGVSDSQYLKGTKQTTSLAWVWILIALAAVVIVIWLTIVSMTR
jgi:type VI protein secretion system component VasF